MSINLVVNGTLGFTWRFCRKCSQNFFLQTYSKYATCMNLLVNETQCFISKLYKLCVVVFCEGLQCIICFSDVAKIPIIFHQLDLSVASTKTKHHIREPSEWYCCCYTMIKGLWNLSQLCYIAYGFKNYLLYLNVIWMLCLYRLLYYWPSYSSLGYSSSIV